MDIIGSVLSIIIGFFTFILILRTWLEFCRVDPRMPLSQSLLPVSYTHLTLPTTERV